MTKINFSKFLRLSSFILIIIFGFSQITKAKNVENLTIFSENNMTYAMTKIVRNYAKKENIAISINFNSSSELINDIDSGEPADIFISSHLDWVKNLSQKGLVDQYSSLNFAKDKLVLVISKDNNKINLREIKKNDNLNDVLQLISQKRIPLIVGSDYSSLGKYTKKIINDSKISNFQIFQKAEEDKKSIIDFVDNHQDYCAIVMRSEIKDDDKIVVLASIPPVDIDYRALVIAGNNMENARKFIKYLKGEEAQDILSKYGFVL